MRTVWWWVLGPLLQLAPHGAWQEVRVGQVVVRAAPEHLDLGIGLAEWAEPERDWYGLGRRAAGPFLLVLVEDVEGLRRATGGRGPTWGAGVTLPGARTIVLRLDGGDPRQTFRHELAHLVLAEAVRGRVPLWFAEGYAVVAAGEWGRADVLRLNLRLLRGKGPSLDELNGALRDDPETVRAAYALAGSALLSLARRHPTGSLRPLVDRLEEGVPFEQAVLATTGLTLDRFDEAWQREVRRRYGVIVWVAAGGLWFVVAIWLLAVRGLRRRSEAARRSALDHGWDIPDA